MKGEKSISTDTRPLDEFNVFVRDNTAVEIIRKIKSHQNHFIDEIVYSRNSFDLFSKEVGHRDYRDGDCVLYSLNGKTYIDKQKVNDRDGLMDKYKVIMTKAMSGGNKPSTDGNYLVISTTMKVLCPYEVCTETYLCLGGFESKNEAINLCNYMKTKFFRFMLLQALTSINISKEKFQFVPRVSFSKSWSDEELYAKYDLTQEEIDFIESMIKPMDLSSGERDENE